MTKSLYILVTTPKICLEEIDDCLYHRTRPETPTGSNERPNSTLPDASNRDLIDYDEDEETAINVDVRGTVPADLTCTIV